MIDQLFQQSMDLLRETRLSASAVLDILIIAVIIYNLLVLIRGTRAYQMVLGIAVMVGCYYLSQLLRLTTVHWLLRSFFTYIVIIVIVLFQAEIKKALASFGRNPFFPAPARAKTEVVVEEILQACTTLASQRMGAIIAVEREVGLKNYIEGGVVLNANLGYDLLLSIFNPSSPLHDGAVIVQGDRIAAAGCFLPLTLDPHLSKQLGTRHRAAIGLSEETDAVVVVVSEETGSISLVRSGEIARHLGGNELKAQLLDRLK
ncbi:MAG: diadenylate cyclase CdaA [Acidobacteriota bacterium]